GVIGLRLISKAEVRQMEPNVEAVAGLYSPSTGIIDSWGLMRSYHGRAFEKSVSFVFNSEVVGIAKTPGGYKVNVREAHGITSLTTQIVINCAGLFCDKVAALAGIDIAKAGYQIHYCRGSYFRLNPRAGRLVSRLVYPVPEQAGKGIHITLNLDGQMKLGPNVKYMDTIDYTVDENERGKFYEAVHRYLPQAQIDELAPDFSGVRPKLQGPGEEFRDFVIRDEAGKGLPGFINLMGIESPGLTSSPAIGKYVAEIVKTKS
ncbi:MAG: FAD-dependent oxidoreductase, partial [Dehalococcoidales bacterium]|nr:FAD-dependent oxidoreductase [Dehalococcoidales bacterium]